MSSIEYAFQKKRNKAWKDWIQKLIQGLNYSSVHGSVVIVVMAFLIGVGIGLGAVGFRWLIEVIKLFFYGSSLATAFSPIHLMIIPAIGGLIVGPLIYFCAREVKGPGISEVMAAVALQGGRIRPRVALVKALASSITIGTGGSVGREGPIAQIGATLGSSIGQWLNLSDDQIRNLVACGAAGGVAATFNAPIAGSIFVLEVILGEFHVIYFGAVVISAVTADVVAHFFEGDARAFAFPTYTLISAWEMNFYTILGVFSAISGLIFTRMIYFSEDIWNKIPLPEYFKPMIGGILLGVIGIFTFKYDGFPRIFSVGYGTIEQTLVGHLSISVTLALFFLKMFATSLTIGSGGSGGIFAPSLFMGAMLGYVFGQVVHQLFPTITAPAGAYALVGMAAFFSSVTHAPVSAILILFEMTGNYSIILPLMLATVISTLISRIISEDSIYTLKLSRRGIKLRRGEVIDVMQGITVGEAMNTDITVVSMDMTLDDLAGEFAQTHNHAFPVIDEEEKLMGVVSIQDLERAMQKGPIKNLIVADIATTQNLIITYPDQSLGKALRQLGIGDFSQLPVVAHQGSRRVIGTLRRPDIIRAYNNAIISRAQQQYQMETLRLGKIDEAGFVQVEIPPRSPVVGHQVSEIQLPEECLIVSVRRKRKLHIAHGYTILHAGDYVTVFANHSCISAVRQQLAGEKIMDKEKPGQRSVRHRYFTIPPGATCAGKMIQDLSLPVDCIMVSVRRDDKLTVAHKDTVLQAGDTVEIFGMEDDLLEAEWILTS